MLPNDSYPYDNSPFYPPISPSHNREDGRIEGILTFDEVEGRLIEAVRVAWRQPDREAGWLHVKSAWPDIVREHCLGDYDARGYLGNSSDVPLRPASLTRAEVLAMEEAFGWLVGVDLDAEDRRIIGMAISEKAAGRKKVPWRSLLSRLGRARGAGGLKMRYRRGLSKICQGANARKSEGCALSNGKSASDEIMVVPSEPKNRL